MRPHLIEHAVVTFLKQSYNTPWCQVPSWRLCSGRFISKDCRLTLGLPGGLPRGQKQQRGYQTKAQIIKKQGAAFLHPTYENQPGNSAAQIFAGEQDGKGLPTDEQTFAVLGGGITGLAAAYYLTREIPTAKITIYEGSDQLGGWLRSKRVDVEQGTVLFETGPRTLRSNTPAGMVILEMVSVHGTVLLE